MFRSDHRIIRTYTAVQARGREYFCSDRNKNIHVLGRSEAPATALLPRGRRQFWLPGDELEDVQPATLQFGITRDPRGDRSHLCTNLRTRRRRLDVGDLRGSHEP